MSGRFGVLVWVAAASMLATPAAAWLPETRVAMVDQAVRLMPESFSQALTSHRRDLLDGLLTPMTADSPDRKAPWNGGTLELGLARAAAELEEALARPTPFPELARGFGRVAHYVLEAGFPPGVSQGDGAARYAHFAAFCDSRRERFPLVFYGHADAELARQDYSAFALEIMRRASEDDRELGRAYRAAGDPPSPAAFDDRSVPFAVGSLAYSRSINDVARAWLALWSRAGGDMARTPYLRSGAASSPAGAAP